MGKHDLNRRAVFLDRDGVLNVPVVRNGQPYPPQSFNEFCLYDDALGGCSRLKAAGLLLVVVTNQPDVGRGTQTVAAVEDLHRELRRAVPVIDRIETCYHAGERFGESCDCRKPRPGMLLRAAAAMNIDLSRSYLIGDRWRDVDCARAVEARAVFIDRGYAEELRQPPDFFVHNFSQAVDAVLRDLEELPLPSQSLTTYPVS
jgi:D-glycero-D-manno-heptose 1,7-bisphosphate phosphatase